MGDAPVEEIKIEKVSVFVDPFQEVEEDLKKQREEELAKASEELKMIPKPVEKKQKAFSSGWASTSIQLSRRRQNVQLNLRKVLLHQRSLKPEAMVLKTSVHGSFRG